MEMPWRALRGSGAFPAGLGGFLSAPAGGERGKQSRQGMERPRARGQPKIIPRVCPHSDGDSAGGTDGWP